MYWHDPEFQFFIRILLGSTIIIWASLAILLKKPIGSLVTLDAFFEVISFTTTTGFSPAAFDLPRFMPMLLLFCCLIGGCAGSTSGGLKAIRVLLLQKQGAREIQRLIHPQGQYVVRLGDKSIETRVIEAIWGFFAIYIVVFSFLLLLLLVVEEDFYSIYSALIAALSNTGRGLGRVADNFAALSNYAKWVLSLAMLAGRLEILTLLVILSPAFWRR